jgi:uncharacterized tellurite resistance protein B-like protein
MLDALRKFFERRFADAEPGHDADAVRGALEIATAALMVEMLRADDGTREVETALVERLLRRHFHIDDDAVARLLELGSEKADQSVSLHEFTRLIHDHFSVAQKTTVVEMLWRVAAADGRIDPHEELLVRKVADLLYLPQAAWVKAREAALGSTAE